MACVAVVETVVQEATEERVVVRAVLSATTVRGVEVVVEMVEGWGVATLADLAGRAVVRVKGMVVEMAVAVMEGRLVDSAVRGCRRFRSLLLPLSASRMDT